jgi:oligopeptidase B
LVAYQALAQAPGGAQVMFESISLFESFVVLWLRIDGSEQMQIVPDEGEATMVALPEPIHCLSSEVNLEFRTHFVRYHYQSPITPATVYRLDVRTGASEVLKQDQVLGGFRREDYFCERLQITARDGTLVPISLVYRAGLDRSRPQPTLLYGYGSYGISIDPTFSSVRLSLLQRGVIFAIAHVRGGGELGEPWRLAGRMEHKMNTFHDFIDCAVALCQKGYSEPGRLAATGGSAGGLLMGVVCNLRPDLFAAIISKVPFVDVINTMLDASLPLTTGEYIEWGNPNEEEAFRRMLEYSPYDNVKRQSYPTTLVEVSYFDSQVPYWEGAKLVAKVRAHQAGEGKILLKTQLEAGHGGASGRYDALKDAAFDYAFLLWNLGVWHPGV